MTTITFSPSAIPVSNAENDTRFPIDEALLDRARSLATVIRDHADAAERERRLAPAVIDAMRAAGLYRLFTPRALGGLEVDPVTFARVTEEIARYDSVVGWSMQTGNTGSWWASRFSDSVVEELFANGPDVLSAASFSPPHRAEEINGGYRFTGDDSAWPHDDLSE